MFSAAAPQAGPLHNPNKDNEVQTTPDLDGVSSLNFSPCSSFFTATSWNNSAYLWEYNQQAQSNPKASQAMQAPVLCSAWKPDGTGIFLGGCDKAVRLWDLGSNQVQQVAAHDAPVRHVAWCKAINMIITGSWDKTFKFWDTRSPTAAYTGTLPERVYAMDVRDEMVVIGTAERNLHVFQATAPQQVKVIQSQLKWQTRCVSIFPDKRGFLTGSIEGRVAVTHINDADSKANFTFKCHRDADNIYAVNAIAFQPTFGTFVTAGSDGTYNFWDKDQKQRLKATGKAQYQLPNNQAVPAPVTACSFDHTGAILGYALSYDWSKGFSDYQPQYMKSYVMLHVVKEDEVKPKPKAASAPTGRK